MFKIEETMKPFKSLLWVWINYDSCNLLLCFYQEVIVQGLLNYVGVKEAISKSRSSVYYVENHKSSQISTKGLCWQCIKELLTKVERKPSPKRTLLY